MSQSMALQIVWPGKCSIYMRTKTNDLESNWLYQTRLIEMFRFVASLQHNNHVEWIQTNTDVRSMWPNLKCSLLKSEILIASFDFCSFRWRLSLGRRDSYSFVCVIYAKKTVAHCNSLSIYCKEPNSNEKRSNQNQNEVSLASSTRWSVTLTCKMWQSHLNKFVNLLHLVLYRSVWKLHCIAAFYLLTDRLECVDKRPK